MVKQEVKGLTTNYITMPYPGRKPVYLQIYSSSLVLRLVSFTSSEHSVTSKLKILQIIMWNIKQRRQDRDALYTVIYDTRNSHPKRINDTSLYCRRGTRLREWCTCS